MWSKFYSLYQKVIEKKYGVNDEEDKVIMFHQVNDDVKEWKEKDCSITTFAFKTLVEELIRSKTKICNIYDIETEGKGRVFLTFDDIFEDAYKNAIPILLDNNIPFTIFISTELIGKEGYIQMEELRALVNEPLCTIGFHTKGHKVMRFLTTNEVEWEINRDELERIIGRNVDCFAFPYGSVYAVSRKNILQVKKANYRLIFSTLRISSNKKNIVRLSNVIPRINVNEENYKELLIEVEDNE